MLHRPKRKNYFYITTYWVATLFIVFSNAQAQDTSSSRLFTNDYFEQFAPRTALEMLNRIPGFGVKAADTNRGIGQGGANILLNGQLITGKGDDASNVIERINASSVKHIEILDGASLNIPGLTGQVANIVTQSKSKTKGSWEWKPEIRQNVTANLVTGRITLSGKSGNIDYTASLKNNSLYSKQSGPRHHYNPGGVAFQRQDEIILTKSDNPGASLNLTYKPKENQTLNFGIEHNRLDSDYTIRSTSSALTAEGMGGYQDFLFAEGGWNTQIDADYERPLASGRLKLIGYYYTKKAPVESIRNTYDQNTIAFESINYRETANEAENILRAEYSQETKPGHNWQLAAEGVYNYLKVDSEFENYLTNTVTIFDPTKTDELRSEITATHGRPLSAKLDSQFSIGVEYSKIQSDVTTPARSSDFVRPKGFLSLTYKPDENFNIRTKIEREVGQLDFYDFIAVTDLETNLNLAANNSLVPEQSWIAEIEFDKTFNGDNSFKAMFFGEHITDLVDQILINDTTSSVGNIEDTAYRYGVKTDLLLKGNHWGLKGTELAIDVDYIETDVTDPITGYSRRIPLDRYLTWNVNYRHDIPKSKIAYGLSAFQTHFSLGYSTNVIDDFMFKGPALSVFIEHKDLMGIKARLDLRNLKNATNDMNRILYTGVRQQSDILRREYYSREYGPYLSISLSSTF